MRKDLCMHSVTQSKASSVPEKTKSSPCTTHLKSLLLWTNTHGLDLPWTKPCLSSSLAKKASHLWDASLVPYRHLFRRAHLPGLSTSGGRLTYTSRSMNACRCAFFASMTSTVLPPFPWDRPVAVQLKSMRSASIGGIAAKNSSVLYRAMSLATQRQRTSGSESSPLLVSTQRPPKGGLPVLCQHSVVCTSSQTCHKSMNSSSSRRAVFTSFGGKALPEISSQNSAPEFSENLFMASCSSISSPSGSDSR